MLFTKEDIKHHTSLHTFFRAHGVKEHDKVMNGNLVCVYSKERMIKILEEHIKRNGSNPKYKRFFQLWNDNLEILKNLK